MRGSLAVKRGKYYMIISYKDDFGEWKRKWMATGLDEKGNKRKAEQLLQEALLDFKNNYQYNTRTESHILFADFIEQWLERAKPNLQISTYGSYLGQVTKIADYFRKKKIKLLDLKPMDIADYYSYLQANGKSIQLCEHYHVNIRRALQTAVRADLIPNNPADRIDRPRSPKHVAKFYNSDELNRFFTAIKGDKFEYIYRLTAMYGLRRSETIGIKWKNVDFKNNVLTLSHAVVQTRVAGKSIVVAKDRMKNQSSLRSLPLLPEIKEMLLEKKREQEENEKLYGSEYVTKYKEYVCVDALGYRINPDTASSRFRLLLERNNLPKIKLHELRHSCASLLLECGIGMKEIQEWLGHSTYTTTADIYSHLNYTSKLNVADAISSKFKNEIDIEKDYDEEEEEVKVIKKSPWDDDYLKGYDKPKPRHPHSRPKEVEDNTMKLNKEKKDTLVVSESDYADFLKWQKQLNKKQNEDEM